MGNEAILYITGFVPYLLGIIPLGAVVVIVLECFKKMTSDDHNTVATANRRIHNTIVASVIATSILSVITFLQQYFI